MKDPHPGIRHQANLDGWDRDADIDPDAFAAYQQYKALLHPPANRAEALNQLDQVLGANDGATLRQKSELMRVRQRLSDTHQRLLKLGR